MLNIYCNIYIYIYVKKTGWLYILEKNCNFNDVEKNQANKKKLVIISIIDPPPKKLLINRNTYTSNQPEISTFKNLQR